VLGVLGVRVSIKVSFRVRHYFVTNDMCNSLTESVGMLPAQVACQSNCVEIRNLIIRTELDPYRLCC